jgi:hypothetical protein
MQTNRTMKWSTSFFVWTILETIACLVFLLLIPPDPKNQFFLGYSLSRWLMVLGFTGLIFFLLFLAIILPKRAAALDRFETFFLSKTGIWIAFILLVSFIGLTVLIPLNERFSPYFTHLLPILGWGFAFFGSILAFQLVLSKGELARQAWKSFVNIIFRLEQAFIGILGNVYLFFRRSPIRILGLVLLIALPVLFQNAFRFNLPVGYAGLYTLMSDNLANNRFILPQWVSYYGPGGMPYAYPPLAFYLMGFITRILGVPAVMYLRFAAPLFSWLCIIPIFFLSFELTGSCVTAVVASMIVASSGYMYLVHSEAGGIVRALAFFFSLSGLFFFYRQVRQPGWKYGLLSSLMFGLTILTHLSYALFFAIGVFSYILVRPLQIRRWMLGILVGITGALIASPWWLTIISRYGIQVLVGPISSHGNDYFLAVFTDLNKLIPWIDDGISIIRKDEILFGLVITGLVYSLVVKKFYLPLWFGLLILFISEGWRFTIFVGALLAGVFISEVYHGLTWGISQESSHSGSSLRGIVFVFLLLFIICDAGYNEIATFQPSLSEESYLLAGFIQQKTETQSNYLLAAKPDESEWFPYLLQRTPLVASWGGEWTGTYATQLRYVLEVENCEDNQSLSCLEGVIAEVQHQPDYLITHTASDLLTQQIESSVKWQKIYQDGRYLVWLNRKTGPVLK